MTTVMTPEAWHRQFTRQAEWTRASRTHLYRRANLLRAQRVLDVGCGTGAVTEELAARTKGHVVGLDIDPVMVAFAQRVGGRVEYREGDAHDLPFQDAWFDVTVCHFLLLWCRDPHLVAQEMGRVTRPGGAVLVCAEPDYGGRIDYPDLPVRQWQIDALCGEGADPCLGRKLREIFAVSAVRSLDVGLVPGLWDLPTLRSEFESEWSLWERSLTGQISSRELVRIKAEDWAAIESGERFVFMPVFFAFVRV
ncbi:MAG: methyltransferase domain-containing protein [Anaerolineae bacterium]|jgi:SAM-dependent methyltransferase